MSRSGFLKTVRNLKKNELLITPRVTEFLIKNPNMIISDENAEVLRTIVTDNSNSVRHGRFGASSRGTCLRQQIFKYLGMPGKAGLDPILHNIFLDGTWRHIRWQMMGLEAGFFTHVEVPAAKPKLRLSISIDALNQDEEWLFELKGASRMPNEVPEKHLLQIGTYFLVTGYEKAVYLVEDKRSQDWKEWVVYRDPKIMKSVEEELDALNEAVEHRKLPAALPGAASGKEGECKTCPFQPWCHQQGSRYPGDGQWVTG